MKLASLVALALAGCPSPTPPAPPPPPPPTPPTQIQPVATPMQAPQALGPVATPMQATQPPLGPVAPGNYVNHVGNPAAGQWGPDGQWQWKDPKSPEADSTWKYLAAAGAGAAVGGLASYMLSRKQFEKQQPGGWSAQSNTREVATHMDRRGNPISADEYERRRAQSERDRQRYRQQKEAQARQPQQYRDKNGRFISKEEYERRKAQSARDRQRYQQPGKPRPAPKPRSRSRRKRR